MATTLRLIVPAVLLAGMPFIASSGVDTEQGQADERAVELPQSAIDGPGIEMNAADREFLGPALQRSRLITQALEVAERRSRTPEIELIADEVRQTHVALTEGLVELAGPNTGPATTHVSPRVSALDQAPADEFDQQFVQLMLDVHRQSAEHYQQALEDPAVSESVRKLARQSLPMIEFHIELMQEVERFAGTE